MSLGTEWLNPPPRFPTSLINTFSALETTKTDFQHTAIQEQIYIFGSSNYTKTFGINITCVFQLAAEDILGTFISGIPHIFV